MPTIRVVTGVTVEYTRVRIAAPGRVNDPYCITDPDDCCADPGNANGCCPAGVSASIPFTFAAPIGEGGADVLITGDLIESKARYSGVFTSEGGAILKLAIDCKGEQWYANGVLTYVTGEVKRFTLPLVEDGTDLVADVEIPGRADGALIIENPCAESGGGSGESGGGGSGESGGGGVDACGCTGIPSTLYATFSGAVSGLGTLTLTYLSGVTWRGTLPDVSCCPGGGSFVDFSCVSGNWQIVTAHPALSFTGTQTSEVCTPFAVGLSGTATGPFCPGAFTVTVDTVP